MARRISVEGHRVGSEDMIRRQKEKGKRKEFGRGVQAPLMFFPFAFFLLPFSFAFAQSGRQTPPPPKPQPPSQSQGGRSVSPRADETRPRRASEESQDDKPLKLKADLVTVITSVTDSAGNQINDLTQKDFEVYEDDAVQDIAGFYREGQIPLRLIFLFDISGSIRHRFDFEQRAAAQFFRNVMRNGDQAALMSVSSESRIELQFTSDVDQLVDALARSEEHTS